MSYFIKYISIACLLALFIINYSCQEVYEPDELDDNKSILVVTGGITDQPGPYNIKLQWASSLKRTVSSVIYKATVIIQDDKGFSEKLVEGRNGIYSTVNLKGVPGNSYKISITLPDKTKYESDFELLAPPVTIDSMYVEIGDKDYISHNYEGDIMIKNYQGLYVFADINIPSQEQKYVLFNNSIITQRTYITNLGSAFPPTVYWRITSSPDQYPLIKASVNFNSGQIIKKFPIVFLAYVPDLSQGVDSISTPYTNMGWIVSTKTQYLSYTAYKYYENINKQIKADFRLFDPIVSQVKGNLHCLNDSTRPVLGYFSATSSGTTNTYFYWNPLAHGIVEKHVDDPGPFIDSISVAIPFDFWVDPR